MVKRKERARRAARSGSTSGVARDRRASRLYALVITALFAFVVRADALSFDFVYLDDNVLVVEDRAFLTGPSAFEGSFARTYLPVEERDHAYYRPLVTASYVLDAKLGGVEPSPYHFTNVLLHAVASLLVCLWLRALGSSDGAAFFGGLVFAAHPALTSAVAWIPGRPDQLLCVFALLAWLLFLRAWRSGSLAAKVGHHVLFGCALLSKEAALVLPVTFLLGLVRLEKQPLRAAFTPWLAGWPIVIALYGAARAAATSSALGVTSASLGEWWANASVFVTSLGKLVVPVGLSVLATRADTPLWPGIVALGVLAGAVLVTQVERGRWMFAAGCFVLWVLPNLPASRVLVLESRLYLPAVAVVFLLAELAERAPGSVTVKRGAALLGILALSASSIAYGRSFEGRVPFAEAAVRGAPRSSLAHRNLGVTYHRAGRADLAEREYREALRLDPMEPVVNNNLAVIFMAQGRLEEAERLLRRELAVNPSYAPARENLALVLRARGAAVP